MSKQNTKPTRAQLRLACRILALAIVHEGKEGRPGTTADDALDFFLDDMRDFSQDIGEQAAWAIRKVYGRRPRLADGSGA